MDKMLIGKNCGFSCGPPQKRLINEVGDRRVKNLKLMVISVNS